jgi:cysteine-rich secretory family protein
MRLSPISRGRRWRRRGGKALLLCAPVLALSQIASATASQSQQFVSYINNQRAAHGARTLRVASDLAAYAYSHSKAMAAKQTIYHSTDAQLYSIPGWTGIGENVGMGDTVQDLNDAFMASKEHRFNILYPGWNLLGIGTVERNNVIYVTEIFVIRPHVRHYVFHSSGQRVARRPARAHRTPVPSSNLVAMTMRLMSFGDALPPAAPGAQTSTRPTPPAPPDKDQRPAELAVQTERPKAVVKARKGSPPPP